MFKLFVFILFVWILFIFFLRNKDVKYKEDIFEFVKQPKSIHHYLLLWREHLIIWKSARSLNQISLEHSRLCRFFSTSAHNIMRWLKRECMHEVKKKIETKKPKSSSRFSHKNINKLLFFSFFRNVERNKGNDAQEYLS